MTTYENVSSRAYSEAVSIEYGYISGNDTVLLIIVGQGGSIYGFNNKYEKMADYYHRGYGVTVVVASNPYDGTDMLGVSIDFVRELAGNDAEIYCMGVSNGGRLCAQYGYMYPNISKMLIVNAPLMINWHRTKKGIERFRGKSVKFIYGSADPSFPYVGLIPLVSNDIAEISVDIVEGADHNFKSHEEEFLMTAECFFKFNSI